MRTTQPTVVCFGEILWDFLPAGLFVGGAPFNVAYHLHCHGVAAHLLSAVGDDLLGEELLRRMQAWGLSTGSVARLGTHPTGYVRATLGTGGDARYTIVENVAWDHVQVTPSALALSARADAVVFGSLAQRGEANRLALDTLLAALPDRALRVFDVNLRAPFDDLALVRRLASNATLLKVNSDEAARLAEGTPDEIEANARTISRTCGCPRVCVTGGARGAGLLDEGRWHWEHGRPVEVEDTIGAGDAFLACLVAGLVQGPVDVADVLTKACRLGEWVATQRGATPDYATNKT
ncbi:carbohydrate kinase [Opitutales bacterium ASA1]|uniref:PfkB family carbohydrate kinase n=1 Tax=Congregicoccus parvus TaxID=3081749 RepID=UPI002B2AD209|nr:carbohydrate kinase [Opitutales bacterium ASA1]